MNATQAVCARQMKGRSRMTRPATVLLVESRPARQKRLANVLLSRGFEVDRASSGRQALALAEQRPPDLVVLDMTLRDADGLDVCARLREESDVLIIALSSRDEEAQRVAALDAGADDCVGRHFGTEELLARIRAHLRRAPTAADVVCRDIRIDMARHRVYRQGHQIRLTPHEFDLLSLVAMRPGEVITHDALIGAIWGRDAVNRQAALRVLVGQVRRKVEDDPSRPRYLLTEPWIGYRFADEAD